MKNKPIVSVIITKPETIFEDVRTILKSSYFNSEIKKEFDTILKINTSWQHYYPACSTTPWQLESIIKYLLSEKYNNIISAHNGTVVVDPHEGAINNKLTPVEKKYNIQSVFLDSPQVKWVDYTPKNKFIVLDKIFPKGIQIPDLFFNKNIIHLPTMKTHVFTGITGAMKNAFGGLLNYNRHWTHSVIHETLVDLLMIQKEIHPGIFSITDGTFAGDGPGPRAMRWHQKNMLLASSDQVAIDAVAAKIMGFDPMEIKFIRMANDLGLGVGEINNIQIEGEDISKLNWKFSKNENTFASFGQKLIYWGPLKKLENVLLRSQIAPWAFWASNIYHNLYWRNLVGKPRIKKAMKTSWGKLFKSY
ncbi:MAG: DUF362 domain-containing protein [SAR202 cluster bacterium]|nr:DUF362 domain-containing protein [SAR202 cluster bacterium]|tara:strand:- start:1520 stop:2602 length:1083 start_codon:yes stop_codon:yes gene_type:complete